MDDHVKQKLDSFFKNYKLQKFKKGKIIIAADENPLGIYYLTSGVVKRYSISNLGEELTLNIYKPISFFPMSWAFNGDLDHHYYEALTDVEVRITPKGKTVKFIKSEPEVLFNLVQRIYRGLDGYMMRMEGLLGGSALAKVAVELLIFARRFGKKQGNNIMVDMKLTHNNIASQAGMARETVTREMKNLKDMGILEFKNSNLLIFDIQRLEELARG